MRRLASAEKHAVQLTLNGKAVEGRAEPRMLLSDFLRHELGATGTHVGCEHGVCGACTVRINGSMARACLVLAVQVQGAEIVSIEGLSTIPGRLGELQEQFHRHFALQCGFCTPGILMSLDTLLNDEPHSSEDRIREVLSGHLCRCTGYENIIKAAMVAAQNSRAKDV